MSSFLAGKIDSVMQRSAIESLEIKDTITYKRVSRFETPTTKAVVNDASVLMAVGSENASNRRALIIRNDGEGVALIAGVSTGGGFRLLPGKSVVFEFDAETITEDTSAGTKTVTYADVSIYARAETISTEIYIEEV